MTRKEMRQKMFLKVRMNYKAYLLLIIVAILFTTFGILSSIHYDAEDLEGTAMMFIVSFLYWPLTIHSAICSLERSKINYLVPRSQKEIKQFIYYQIAVKWVLNFIICTILLGVFYCINPDIFKITLNCYLIASFSFSNVLCMSGLNGYYLDGKKHRQYGSAYYTFLIIIGSFIGAALTMGTSYLVEHHLYQLWNWITAAICVGSLIYSMYSIIRSRYTHATYENVSIMEGRLCKVGKQLMS